MEFREGSFCDFETDYKIWNANTVKVGININDDNDVEQYEDKILNQLEWINLKRHIIEQAILDSNMTESAEFWISNAEQSEDGDYLLQSGEKVSLPLSDDEFCKSLKISEMSVNIEEDGSCDVELYFVCKPDYFSGQCIEVLIDCDKNISCDGLSG